MPRPGSTSLKPSTSRNAAADLRSKVIGTNTLLTELTEKIRTLVEAQHALVTALTELVVMLKTPTASVETRPFVGFGPATALMQVQPATVTSPWTPAQIAAADKAMQEMAARQAAVAADGRQAADMMREASRSWGAHRASTLAQARSAVTGDTIIEDAPPVPRGTAEIPQPTSEQAAYFEDLSQRHVQWSEPGNPNSFEPHPGPVRVEQHSLDADMAAELAEYAEDEDDTPQPPDDAEQDDLWSRRLSLHRNMRMWKPEWGPRPGQTGCNVPAHLLNGRA